MKEVWKGKRIAEKLGYRLIPHFFDILYILENWSIINKVVYNYDYHEKRFLITFKKYDNSVGDAGFVDIADYIINIIRESPNEFKVIVNNVDANFGEKSREYLRKFLRNIFKFKGHKVYFYDVLLKSSLTTHELKFRVRKISLAKSQSLIDGSEVRYYPGLRKFERLVILGKGSNDTLYIITEINNRPISYYTSRIGKMPKLNRIALRNHKIQFEFFKMLLNKGILMKDEKAFHKIPTSFTITDFPTWKIAPFDVYLTRWRFSSLYNFNEKRVNATFRVDFLHPILVDYNYDETNQVLLKFADRNLGSVLCGLDYKNTMWCITLPGITKYWRIQKIYKYVYALDEYTKMFEY